jgi:parallel beta-helix repeat protein
MTRMSTPARTVLSLSALALCITGAVLYAGPLNPPAGPVTSTYKTLTEVEPRTAVNATNTPGSATALHRITQPGSYYLAGNITGVNGKHGVTIEASGVTLDLNGFDLQGVAGMGVFSGVFVPGSGLTNITVINGSVRNWGNLGMHLGSFGTGATNCRVEGVLASGNAGNGITVSGGSTITNCSASQNDGNGIVVGGPGSTVTNCSATQNTLQGIEASSASACTISNCSVSANAGSGIAVSLGGTVTDCTARTSGLDGIQCFAACLVRGNTSSFNGSGGDGAGVHALGGENRIEGNNCTSNDSGIRAGGTVNLVFGNSCRANTSNYNIVAGNRVGTIVVPPLSGVVTGNSGAAGFGTTDPWANIAF